MTSSTTLTPFVGTNDFELKTTQNQEEENDEYMDVNYMVKAQSIIESQAQGELKSSLFANLVQTGGVGLAKTDAQATYELCFRRSKYRWKSKEIRFLTKLAPGQYMVGADQNHHSKIISKICQKSEAPVFGPKGLVHPRIARPPP
jgi:hypothetical protein